MSAYNRINGESATASDRFLNDILRRQWASAATSCRTAAP